MISDSCPVATLICGTLRLCLGRAVNKSMHDEDLHRPSAYQSNSLSRLRADGLVLTV